MSKKRIKKRKEGKSPYAKPKIRADVFELIKFDKKVKIYLGICFALFIIFVGLKMHNSSIPMWNQAVPDGGSVNRGLIAGEPLKIRSDEWLIYSNYIVAQQNSGLPISNESLGYGNTPLAIGLPTNHLVSIVKPHYWGFYLLDAERAFSWHWNFALFPFLMVSFLFLMLFTRNNFLLSVFGSLWIFLSSAVQWWSINTLFFTYGFLTVMSFIYILYSKKPKVIIANGVLFFIAAFAFATTNIYPAYLVPLSYFFLALFIGYIFKNRKELLLVFKDKFKWRALMTILSLLAIGYFLFMYYQEAKDTMTVMSRTAYPGLRKEFGGDFEFLKMFTDNFSLFLNENKFPSIWRNICEQSSYLMLAPIVTILVIVNYIKTKKIDRILLAILVFQLIIYAWLFVGFPDFLAEMTLFKTSPTYRTFFIFGFSNVVGTILFLSYNKDEIIKTSHLTKILVFVSILVLVSVLNYFVNQQSGSYFSTGQVLLATTVFSILNWLVIYYFEKKIYQFAFYGVVLLFVISNITVNPLSQGLSPYYENNIYKTVSEIKSQDPSAGWAVFGPSGSAGYAYSNFIKSTGVNCFTGTAYVPPVRKLSVLDPAYKDIGVYNRFGHINFETMIDGNDSVLFKKIFSDQYTIRLDPCSPRLEFLGIEYLVFGYTPKPEEIRCMSHVITTSGIAIYKRN